MRSAISKSNLVGMLEGPDDFLLSRDLIVSILGMVLSVSGPTLAKKKIIETISYVL